MSETLGEARKRLARAVESQPWLAKVVMRRQLRKLNRKIDGERDRVLRRDGSEATHINYNTGEPCNCALGGDPFGEDER